MKNIVKIIALSLLFAFNVACSNDDDGPGNNQNLEAGFVEISPGGTRASQMVVFGEPGANSEITIPLFFNGALNPTDLMVEYQVVDMGGISASEILTATSGTAIIPAGSRIGDFPIGIRPDATLGFSSFDVVLTSVSGRSEVQLGLVDGSRNLVHSISACSANILASYTGQAAVPAFNLGDETFSPFTATLTQVGDGMWDIDTAWGPNFVAEITANPGFAGQFIYPTTLTLDFTTQQVTLSDDGNVFNGGTGTYDRCTNIFTYQLTQSVFMGNFTVDVVLTPM